MEVKESQEISPKDYNKFLKDLNLRDIFLTDIKSSLKTREFTGSAKFNFHEQVKLVKYSPNTVVIEVKYILKAKNDKRIMFNIESKYNVIFTSKTEIPREFFDVFNKINLPLQTFPYFRELANSTISKMGLPPLVLPLKKGLIGGN